MPIYDVTVPVSNELPTWPSDPGVEITDWRSFASGDGVNVSMLNLGAHTGTHVDAPAHFIQGAAKVESLSLDALIGEALVIEVPEEFQAIDEEFVQKHYVTGTERVLFKTRNSAFWSEAEPQFHTDFTYLDLPAARWLSVPSVARFLAPSWHRTHAGLP